MVSVEAAVLVVGDVGDVGLTETQLTMGSLEDIAGRQKMERRLLLRGAHMVDLVEVVVSVVVAEVVSVMENLRRVVAQEGRMIATVDLVVGMH